MLLFDDICEILFVLAEKYKHDNYRKLITVSNTKRFLILIDEARFLIGNQYGEYQLCERFKTEKDKQKVKNPATKIFIKKK